METITGTVHKVMWASPEKDNHYKVFRLRKKGNEYDTVSGEFEEIIEGAEIEIHGYYKDHPKYGRGFRAQAYTFTFNRDSVYSTALYLQSIAKFIGSKRSYDIARHFGEELEDVIENEPERLTEVRDIGQAIAENLVRAWHDHREEKNVRIFLHGLGLPQKKIKKILLTFGVEAEVKLRENPFLLSLVGFGFSTCDYIAKKLGMSPSSPLRMRYFIIYVLRESRTSGHLYLYKHQLTKAFNSYNEKTTYHFKAGTITDEDVEAPLAQLVEDAYVLYDGERLYELESFFFENESARILHLIQEKPALSDRLEQINIDEFIQEYESEQRLSTGYESYQLSDNQKEAIEAFVDEKVLIVTGCPGTGKTTVLRAFVELCLRARLSFELLTPTGIAAKKLGNTTEYEAYTIHRRLEYRGDGWGFGSDNKYNTDVVIVDETSMVDMEVCYRLLSALYTHTRVVFVGDNDQLPSVGPGRVLNELIKSNVIKTIFLMNIFRQEEQSDIIKEAKKIRDGDADLEYFRANKTADIWFLRSNKIPWIEDTLVRFASDLKSAIKDQSKKKTFQIITPRNAGPLSVETLNIALQEALNPKKREEREISLNTCVIRRGDRVLIKKNNYDLDVFNGDIGKVSMITPRDIIIEIDDFEGTRSVPVPIEIAEDMLKLAYCITIHKCINPETKIATKHGAIAVNELKEGNLIINSNGSYPIRWVGKTAPHEAYEIETRSGYRLRCSPEHRIMTADERGEHLKEARDISTNDFACIQTQPLEGHRVPVQYERCTYGHTTKDINLPPYVDRNLAWLLGIITGDGSCRNKKDGIVEISAPASLEIRQRVRKIFKGYTIRPCEHKRGGKEHSVYVSSVNFRRFLLSVGMGYDLADKKRVPPILFESEREVRLAYIAGLIDSDGCVDRNPQIRFTTSSIRLSEDVQDLLLTLGILSQRSTQGPKHHKVTISGPDFAKLKELKLTDVRKAHRLQQLHSSKISKSNRYEIPFAKRLIPRFRALFRVGERRGKKGSGLTAKNHKLQARLSAALQGRHARYSLLQDMADTAAKHKKYIPAQISEILRKKWFYDPVVSIKRTGDVEMMYDLEIDCPTHLLSENGFVCHNSQGLEYDLVIMPIVKAHGKRILQRNLLYTAITRAKKKVIVLGQGSALVNAIENDKIQERNTKLAERLQLWTNGQGTHLQELFEKPEDYQNAQTLKRLLLSEERANTALASTERSSEEMEPEKSQDDTKPARSSKPLDRNSIEKLLKEVESLAEDTPS